tara:strand:+ start:101 stop:346 length:246 start_codon:yes stop_codon:yes gene_type:complete
MTKFSKNHPWIIYMKQSAKQYMINKESRKKNRSKTPTTNRSKTNGQKRFNNVVSKIEKLEKLKKVMKKNKRVIERLRGGRS